MKYTDLNNPGCPGENYAAAFAGMIPLYLAHKDELISLDEKQVEALENAFSQGKVSIDVDPIKETYEASFECDRCLGRMALKVETGGIGEVQRPLECINRGSITSTSAEDFKFQP